jgi:hypothetical protein
MTTSTTATATTPDQGRSIRDVVEHQHALVNEVFCRKIFRQLLASLELQYARQMPHRIITPDTVVIHDNGDPVLLPSDEDDLGQAGPADLHALAAVVHYAITTEWPPGAPLRQRKLAGYSESLLGAVDKCLAHDPRERPRTIEQLRCLLGIVALAPAVPASAPAAVAAPHKPAGASRTGWRTVELSRTQRWALVGGAACVLLGALAGLVALLHNGDPADGVALSLPAGGHDARGLDPNETVVWPPSKDVPTGIAAAPAGASAGSAPGTSLAKPPDRAPPPGTPDPAPRTTPPARTAQAATPRPDTGRANPAIDARTEYKVMIKPWGTVYVDGQDRGVSPPVKRLVLAAGKHTVRIVNPAFPDRVLRIEAGRSPAGRIAHDFSTASR